MALTLGISIQKERRYQSALAGVPCQLEASSQPTCVHAYTCVCTAQVDHLWREYFQRCGALRQPADESNSE